MRASGGVLMDRGSAIPTTSADPIVGGSMGLEPLKDATLRLDANNNSGDASRLRSVDSSSSLSSTVYEDDTDSPLPPPPPPSAPTTTKQPTPTTSTKPPTNGQASRGFEASNFFRFADFGTNATSREDFFASPELLEPGNNEILPPQTVSPSNQATNHDEPDDAEAADVVAPTPTLAKSITHPRMNVVRRRKNSIEMFLSQSPSQALGGGFLKMALDDDDHQLHHSNQPAPPPDLRLDHTGDATAKASAVRPTHQVGAAPSPYGYLGLSHSPAAVDTEDEWSSTSSQEMLSSSASASAYYYAEAQAALHHQSQPSYSYGGANLVAYTNDSYSSNTRDASHVHQQSWNASAGYASLVAASPYQQQHVPPANGSGSAAAAHGRYGPVPLHQYQQHQAPHQQPVYQQPGGHRGHGNPRHGYARSQSMYATPPAGSRMMDSSPPPPVPGVMYGAKQCKFFLQGHCRMGNKCKFAHHTGGHHGASMPSPYAHQQHQHQQPPLHHARSFRLAQPSPASSPNHQQAHHDYDAMATPAPAFLTRTSSNRSASYRGGGGGSDMHQSHGAPHHAGAIATAHADEPLTVDDVHGRVFAMSKDQNGCRLLQEQLEFYEERKQLCDVIYLEAMEHLAEMMVDPFGNYLFQKLLERARPLQRLEMVRRVSGHLVAAALNLHGTRSVQKVVEVCATSAQVVELDSDGNERRRVNLPDLIVEALKDDAVRLCIDSNGNHVIQRALQFMKPEYNQFVFDAVAKECTTVGTHRHGCCVLQRCLDAANGQQKREVIAQVEKQAMKLMQDPYGNYVVQYVLDSCTAEEAYGVISKPLGNVFELSIQKFSSNVIEKCLEKAPPSLLKQYVEEITLCPKMQKMLQDQFANYVVQRALCVATEEQCVTLVKAIRPHLPAMKNTSGGRRITARILKRFPHMDLSLDLGFGPVAHGDGYGMVSGAAYGMHPEHQYQQSHFQYGAPYGMMPPLRGDGSDAGVSPFAPGQAAFGMQLHDASLLHNAGNHM